MNSHVIALTLIDKPVLIGARYCTRHHRHDEEHVNPVLYPADNVPSVQVHIPTRHK